MNTPKRIPRRSFLKTSAAVGATATLSAPAILRGHNLNERLDLAMIGLGEERQLIEAHIELVKRILTADQTVDREQLLSMAAELLQVEQALGVGSGALRGHGSDIRNIAKAKQPKVW